MMTLSFMREELLSFRASACIDTIHNTHILLMQYHNV